MAVRLSRPELDRASYFIVDEDIEISEWLFCLVLELSVTNGNRRKRRKEWSGNQKVKPTPHRENEADARVNRVQCLYIHF